LRGKKLKNLMFLGEIFQIQSQTINGWPDPSHKKFWPGPITRNVEMLLIRWKSSSQAMFMSTAFVVVEINGNRNSVKKLSNQSVGSWGAILNIYVDSPDTLSDTSHAAMKEKRVTR